MSGFYAENVYAYAMKERSSRAPGSQLRVNASLLPCASWLSAQRRGESNQSWGGSDDTRRNRARDVLARRCSQVTYEALSEAVDIAPGDASALLESRLHGDLQLQGITKARAEEALTKLILLGAPNIPVSTSATLLWRGESWANQREDFRLAFVWAQRMASAAPGREADDLRLIEQCFTYGHCNDQYDFGTQDLPPDRYQVGPEQPTSRPVLIGVLRARSGQC